MPGQKLNRFGQQIKCMSVKLALVQELVLVGATESRKPQLALGVMGQEFAAEHYHRRIDKGSPNSESQSIQDVRQIVGGGIGGQSATRDAGLDRPPDLLGVQFINRYFGNFVLPATPRMRTFQQNPLIGFLRHDRTGRSDTLVRPPVVGARQTVSRRRGFQDQDLTAIRVHRNPLCFNWNGGIKSAQNLRQILKCPICNRLADDGNIRSNADQYLSTSTIRKGAKSLSGSGKLSRALLEFKQFGFASSNEVQQVLVCH